MKILIVDNDNVRQRNLRNILSSLGHRAGDITTVADSTEAMTVLKKGGGAVVFCSLALPGGSGLELLSAVREISRLKVLPFIIYSSQISKEEVIAASQAGASGMISYPFTSGDVESVLQSALTKLAKSAPPPN
jgi:two-component system chemotaxis response regulator CheY